MKTRVSFGAIVFVGAVIVISAHVVSQESEKQDEPGEPMMQAWMKYAQPGKFHANLAPLVGRWSQTVKWWMAPGMEPDISTGSCEYKWILGGRFLLKEVKSGSDDESFEGLGMIGYDNFKKKYTSMWTDTMTTAITTSYGTCDESGKVLTLVGNHDDVFTGKPNQTFKMVTRIINNDAHIDEWFMNGPDGKEFKTLEIIYTRR